MKLEKSRYENGSIAKIPRAHGHASRVRFSNWEGGKRKQKSLTFDATKCPNESDVRGSGLHEAVPAASVPYS